MASLYPMRQKGKADRVVLTDEILRHFYGTIYRQSVPALVKRTGLPYTLIYNIVNKRVKSISARDFRIIFGQDPPQQEVKKVDGAFFRQMVDLWLYLNEHVTQKALFLELFDRRPTGKVNYRIFSGKTRTVDPRLAQKMEKKFAAADLDEFSLRQWIAEHRDMDQPERIDYHRIRPVLLFLQDALGVHPTSILNQLFDRYESGELKSVSRKVYRRALDLKHKVEMTPQAQSRPALEKLREQVYGQKQGYTLFSEIEEELNFLKQYAGKKPTAYLGRGTSIYLKQKARRIASWRAQKIQADCAAFIRHNPHLPLGCLPQSHRRPRLHAVLSVLLARVTDILNQAEGLVLEKKILSPTYARDEYKNQIHGFTQFEKASFALGMNKKAFDLMVSSNCEIFREVGRYANRWYLSDLYLKELSKKPHFGLITVKYELMARKIHREPTPDKCMN